MPELPEVETIRRDLEPRTVGRTIERVQVLLSSVLLDSARKLRRALEGETVAAVRRWGKVLIVDFAGGQSLLIHPRMTGQVILCDEGCESDYPRVLFHLSDGHTLAYSDCRALGKLELCPTDALGSSRSLRNFGPDALACEGLDALVEAASRRRIPIKVLLLDQSVLAGIGNIYASEVLHVARVDPAVPACDLTRRQLGRVRRGVREVLEAAIEARGTTFSDYRTGLGTPGEYAGSLRVYGREGERCVRRRCAGTIVRTAQAQRSTFHCPRCQR